MLTRQLFGLGQKALRLASLRHVGPDATGLRAKAVLVVGAHERGPRRDGRKSADIRLECRSKPSRAKALRHVAARETQKHGAVRRAPEQCADKGLPGNRSDRVPVSFILPSASLSLFALPAGNAVRRKPACLHTGAGPKERGNAMVMANFHRSHGPRIGLRPAAPDRRDRAKERLRGCRAAADPPPLKCRRIAQRRAELRANPVAGPAR